MTIPVCECCQSIPDHLITCVICGAKICPHCSEDNKCLDCYHTDLDKKRTFEFDLYDHIKIYHKG